MARIAVKHVCCCGNPINPKRVALGYKNCPECGEASARQLQNQRNRAVMPMHKSNYVAVVGKDLAAMRQNVRDLTGKSGT